MMLSIAEKQAIHREGYRFLDAYERIREGDWLHRPRYAVENASLSMLRFVTGGGWIRVGGTDNDTIRCIGLRFNEIASWYADAAQRQL